MQLDSIDELLLLMLIIFGFIISSASILLERVGS